MALSGGGVFGHLPRQKTHHRVEHRDIDELPFTGMGALKKRRSDRKRRGDAGGDVGHRKAGTHRSVDWLAGERHQARHCLDLAVEACGAALGAGAAKARDAAVDEPGVDLRELRPAHAAPLEHAGAKVLADHVDLGSQALDDFAGRRLGQIKRHAALVGIDRHPGRTQLTFRPFGAGARQPHRVALNRLDLDDIGPLDGELEGAKRPGQIVGEIEDANACEGFGRVHEAVSLAIVASRTPCAIDLILSLASRRRAISSALRRDRSR